MGARGERPTMFVGHALAAFAVVAAVARLRGWDAQRAMRVGVLAGLFATAPDLDILYGPVGLLGGVSGLADATEAFWSTGNVVHRGPTHSLVLGFVAAVGYAAWRRSTVPARAVGLAAFGALVGTVAVTSGLLGAVVTAVFLTGGLGVVALAARWEVEPRTVGLAAMVGLLSHPFGDLFTGAPPDMLYPFDAVLVADRITLHPDPTVNLLAAFGVELLVIWTALVVAYSLTGRSVRAHVDRRAVVGVAYGAAALAIPAPTLDTSYQFVFSVLALGVVGVPRRRPRKVDLPRVACTGLAAVSCAGLAYSVAYLAF